MAKGQVFASPKGSSFGMQRCLSEEPGSPEAAGLLCNDGKHKEFFSLLLMVGWPCCVGDTLVVFGLSPSEP